MPFFKTTENIFNDHGEYFDENWMDSDKLVLPSTKKWDYKREIKIEDVDLWELIYELGQVNVYAAWSPFAEFYLIKFADWFVKPGYTIETYYGPGASDAVYERMKDFGILLSKHKIWIDEQDMYIYSNQ